MDIESRYTGDEKDDRKRFLLEQHKETDIFVKKSYWLCLILFLFSGIAMITAVVRSLQRCYSCGNIYRFCSRNNLYGFIYHNDMLLWKWSIENCNSTLCINIYRYSQWVYGGVNLKMVVSHLKIAKIYIFSDIEFIFFKL